MESDKLQTLAYYTDDVDQHQAFAKAIGWQFHTQQTSRGPLGNAIRLARSHDTIAFRADFLAGTVREALSPAGMMTFGIIIAADSDNRWCNQRYDHSCLLRMPRGDFTAANHTAMTGYQVALPLAAVEESFSQLELAGPLPVAAKLAALNPSQTQYFAGAMETLVRSPSPEAFAQRRDALLAQLLTRLAPELPQYRSRAHQRRQAFARACDYIHAHLDDALTVADLCRYSGVSRRALSDAFGDALGITPMAFLKIVRLNKVRSALQNPDPAQLHIVDVANQYGFWHMGQFAQDYRRLFGELPSATLASRRHSR